MAIKDKNGNVFKLRGPNPILEKQEIWDKSQVKLINITQEELVVEDEKNPIEQFKEEYQVPDIAEIIEPVIIDTQEETQKLIDRNKVSFLCVPRQDLKYKDETYGETYTKTVYLEKFQFEAVILDEQDLFLKFWTTHEISIGSIVYPQNVEKRWWKVTEVESKPAGAAYLCSVSDLNPEFS